MSRRRKHPDPEVRKGLDRLKAQLMNVEDPDQAKYEAAKEKNIMFHPSLTSKDAGKIGGNLGGRMVKELVRIAQQEMTKRK